MIAFGTEKGAYRVIVRHDQKGWETVSEGTGLGDDEVLDIAWNPKIDAFIYVGRGKTISGGIKLPSTTCG